MAMDLRRLEVNGGRVEDGPSWRFELPVTTSGYADAQIDDYGGRRRRRYPWCAGTYMDLRARFSHAAGRLVGTAGFGFWNAPFGDPTMPWPALPQVCWFFYASAPGLLPFAPSGAGRGWFAATMDATSFKALLTAPLAPLIIVLDQVSALRRVLWPWVRRRLAISHALLDAVELVDWHAYRLEWRANGCRFSIDEEVVLETPHTPKGPLGFVCWLDNQYLVATATGRFRWGTLAVADRQWLEVSELKVGPIAGD